MHRINPEKLLLTKWTAVQPSGKERHFIITRLVRDADDKVIACELEAVINKKSRELNWHELREPGSWIMGWQ